MFTKEFCNYIKGISILLVVMIHVVIYRYSDDVLMKVLHVLFYQGDLGVNSFFFLSSYGLCYSYENTSLMGFYKRRLIRLYPIYLISLFFLFCLLPRISFSEIPRLLLLHITGLIVVGGNKIVEWFIPALLLLYMCFPVLFETLLWVSKKKHYLLIYSIILIGCIPLFYSALDFIYPFFLGRFSVILLGIMCYILQKNEKNVLSIVILYASLSLFSFS